MAHPYSTLVRLLLTPPGAGVVNALLDTNHDGTADTGFYDATQERACNVIDARLRGLYAVPFAAVTANPPCDGMISDAADYKTLELLFSGDNPDSGDAKYWRGQFDEVIEKIRTGAYVIDATRQTATTTARAGLSVLDVENSFGLDADGNDNLDRY